MSEPSAATILIVDPEPLIVESIAVALAANGYRTLQAMSRGIAQRMVNHDHVHVLISHGHLHGDSTPFSFATEVSSAHPDMAIVAVTSDGHTDHAFVPERARILLKPFDLSELLIAIADARALARPASS
ncbi:response regulator receiver domain-containing protein [Luteibacter rhizovicinus]|uniref:Response regulator receiver domain-containing protein n=1 Tax=Luteibacter rhizovicinus TaxID=242606 RepID=A0A4R3YNK0_9GAMM|nr:response regulator [Luteibacter rhizovicinus]TCV92734.1 response regulator receiver domain-containing protein [Luteibacter rhizovicinus]